MLLHRRACLQPINQPKYRVKITTLGLGCIPLALARMSASSASVGHFPRARMTVPTSSMLMKPSRSVSYTLNASWMSYSSSLAALAAFLACRRLDYIDGVVRGEYVVPCVARVLHTIVVGGRVVGGRVVGGRVVGGRVVGGWERNDNKQKAQGGFYTCHKP
jgi:hypothetical protein